MALAPFDSLYPAQSRFEEIEKILALIREGNSCQLIGLPGVGRSNLLGFLAYNRNIRNKHFGEQEKNFHFVLINFSELKRYPLFDVMKIIFLMIVESLRTHILQETYNRVNKIFKESLSYQDELILFQGLKSTIDILAIEQQLTVVLLFERFEEYVPMLTTDFFTYLRVLRNRAKYKFSVIFSLNRSLEELLEPAMIADFYELIAGHTIYLPISDAPGNAFRIHYLENATDKKIAKDVIKTITEYTAGHGKLTRICIEILLETNQEKEIMTVPDIQFFLEQKRVQRTLFEIWNTLSPLEQTALTTDKQPEDTFLTSVGLWNNENITIPLFKIFVAERNKEVQKENTKIIFNTETNTITKGNLVLSDKLTVSEFRLLRYLLEHPETIVEKEEIITAVWQDAKSTAGVTDQALDQLIFRLRKKIEEDPNNSQHIQTIKGRGIKFVA